MRLWGVFACLDQPLPLLYPIGMIELQDGDSSPSLWGEGGDQVAVKAEMIGPGLGSRVEEGRQLAGLRVQRSQVSALVMVAVRAGQSQVIQGRTAAVLFGDNVFDLEGQKGECLGIETVLAFFPGSFQNRLA